MIIKGKVFTGIGEGINYICQEGYSKQFEDKLGFRPYPGTLNLELEEPLPQLGVTAIEILGFQQQGRSYGSVRCYPCQVEGIRCAIVRPDRSSYPMSVIEIIAPLNMRMWLNIEDGDYVLLAV